MILKLKRWWCLKTDHRWKATRTEVCGGYWKCYRCLQVGNSVRKLIHDPISFDFAWKAQKEDPDINRWRE